MTKERAQSPAELEAKRTAEVLSLSAQGYTQREIGRQVGISQSSVRRYLERVQKRIPADDLKQWRAVQLLRYERLMAASQAVLDAHHVVVSNGVVVRVLARDDEGKVIWDPVLGPDGEQRTNDAGEPLFEERRVPLQDQGPILEAVAELRKLEVEVSKLLGTQTPVKQAVEVQHVDYTITGVDMSKITGANLKQDND